MKLHPISTGCIYGHHIGIEYLTHSVESDTPTKARPSKDRRLSAVKKYRAMNSKVAPFPGSAALGTTASTGDLPSPQPLMNDAAPKSSGGGGGGGGCWICSDVANDVVTGVHASARELGSLGTKTISRMLQEDQEKEKLMVESLFMMQVSSKH